MKKSAFLVLKIAFLAFSNCLLAQENNDAKTLLGDGA